MQLISDTMKQKKGERFRYAYQKVKESGWPKSLIMAAGLCTLIVGIVLLVLPGTGVLFIIIGISLVATASYKIAKFMDKAEKKPKNYLMNNTIKEMSQ